MDLELMCQVRGGLVLPSPSSLHYGTTGIMGCGGRRGGLRHLEARAGKHRRAAVVLNPCIPIPYHTNPFSRMQTCEAIYDTRMRIYQSSKNADAFAVVFRPTQTQTAEVRAVCDAYD